MHDTQDLPHGLRATRCADEPLGPPPAARAALPAGRVLAAFALTTDVEALIAARLAELRLVMPALRPWHGRHSGRRVLGARSPSEHGEAGALGVIRGVTRVDIEFEVEVEPCSPAVVALACRSTVRGRDRQTTSARIALPDAPAAPELDPAHAALDAPGDVAATTAAATPRLHRVSEWVEDALLVFAADWFESRRTEPRRTGAETRP